MALSQQMLRGKVATEGIVAADNQVVAATAVHQNKRNPLLLELIGQRILESRRGQNQAVDPTVQEPLNELTGDPFLLSGAYRYCLVAMLTSPVCRGLEHAGEDHVGEPGNKETDRKRAVCSQAA